ncbi:MAG: hypothetical protein SF029_07910 [bacterium]|nr:hypothetical protein [bacterium]
MSPYTPTLEEVLNDALRLSALDRIRLIEKVMAAFEQEVLEQNRTPLESWYGLVADLGSAPSAEDIDEVRREMWQNFPREDML